jgi:predicted PurR-regulated permease PerM
VQQQANTWFFFALIALALYLLYLIAQPFLSPIFAAVVLAAVFHPLHSRICISVRGSNLAATLSTALVILIVFLPTVILGIVVTSELGDLYRSLSDKSAAQGGISVYLTHLLEIPIRIVGRYVDLSRLELRSTLLQWVAAASAYLIGLGGRALSNVLSLIFETLVVFFTLFFLFRDGMSIQRSITTLLPLTHEQSERLVSRINETIIASVYGGIAVCFAQGLLTGVAFWLLGLPSPALWGIVAALASLIPVVGTGLVWGPATAMLLLNGHWIKGLVLTACGAAFIAQIDTLVRPYIVSDRAKMNNLLIFFALLGGVEAFGLMGIFIGPVIVAVTIVLLGMLREMNAVPGMQQRTTGVK